MERTTAANHRGGDMATGQMNRIVQRLRRAVLLPNAADMTDEQLLNCFIRERDETAYEALLRRHGPLVWGVCRRVLRNHHDAEDAFQATFLVLAQKAAAIARRELLAHWLYGVACKAALKARAVNSRRAAREKKAAMPETEANQHDPWEDVYPVLDQELSLMPEKYRLPILLCDLQGKTQREAADELGWPIGTLSGRLSRARGVLAKRLTRRGMVWSAGSLGALLAEQAASASMPTAVVPATVQAATLLASGQAASLISAKVAAITEGVLKTMLLTKLKILVSVLLVLGAATLACAVLASGQLDGKTGDAGSAPGAAAEQPLQGKGGKVAAQPKKENADFEKAVIEPWILKDGATKADIRTITEGADVQKLATFFPGMGQGKKPSANWAWKTAYAIKFERPGTKPVIIYMNLQCEYWNEGAGQWDAKPGLKAFLEELYKKGDKARTGSAASTKMAVGDWSKVVNKLQGRLVHEMTTGVVHEFAKGKTTQQTIFISVELKNASSGPLAVRNDPAALKWEVLDTQGKPVPGAFHILDSEQPLPQWVVLPPYSYLGFSLYDYGVSAPGKGTLLPLLPNGDAWLLQPGEYTLRAAFTSVPAEKAPKDAWVGHLELPPLKIVVK